MWETQGVGRAGAHHRGAKGPGLQRCSLGQVRRNRDFVHGRRGLLASMGHHAWCMRCDRRVLWAVLRLSRRADGAAQLGTMSSVEQRTV